MLGTNLSRACEGHVYLHGLRPLCIMAHFALWSGQSGIGGELQQPPHCLLALWMHLSVQAPCAATTGLIRRLYA